MANINKANIKYILDAEGGLSRDPNDSASSFPVPDGSGYHTNKGITWKSFVSLAHRIGYTATPALFYKMPHDIWLKIYKRGYWDPVKADKINSQAIAELIVDFGWGSGPGTATKVVQRVLNRNGERLIVDGGFGEKTLAALNRQITRKGEKRIFQAIYDARVAFLKSLADFQHFGRGWMDRMQDLYDYGMSILKNHGGKIFFLLGCSALVIANWDEVKKIFK